MSVIQLEGKVAIVTGASRGLGKAMALALAKAGADIVGIGVSGMENTKSEVESLNRRFYRIQADFSKSAEVEKAALEAIEQAGHIDILVNNAGIIRRSPAAEFTQEDWKAVMDVNLDAVFLMCSIVGKHMLKRGQGKIINIASMLSFQGGLRVPAYTASKHGVAGLTKSLANEWASKGINVNAIAPGYMATDNTEALRNDAERNEFILSRIPAGRWGTPEDLAGPTVFLASDASNYVNGHILCVDGGWMNF
ncbi:2-dehydro-3-deoxy-D-gluconate 5-dehydrogenase KduD [Chengkuizengella axinellae]|uniref:2-dehydro-3-deoxy-D-gluconate 5-dehydrogenase KduD n=1 Tax=Chengkuizengella axinellae TaxID=3064388 RepID=A0ABT9IZM4_9BACL|nr:2-dehydro-3-deoxy-D-gluconate 5-dehydrogenase KduD [Chengkuizengella sp. 2205SS18-9]MDP5274807.1 2-dehydro-3-deoxy-D-gluconate 5-dehydrogenase KduD [Chengkuizengella sp. 2205SS18-9]